MCKDGATYGDWGTFSRVSLIGTSPLRNVASLEEECPILKLVASYVAVQSPQSG